MTDLDQLTDIIEHLMAAKEKSSAISADLVTYFIEMALVEAWDMSPNPRPAQPSGR